MKFVSCSERSPEGAQRYIILYSRTTYPQEAERLVCPARLRCPVAAAAQFEG
jgi:hypothetical protein